MNKAGKTYESPDMLAMLKRVGGRGLVKRAAIGDLEALSALQEAERVMHDALGEAVTAAREQAGYSWGDIARELGMSRQAAQQRFGKRDEQAS